MAQDYKVTATQPFTYLDSLNQIVNGFRVFVTLTQFDEVHQVMVPNLNPETVKSAVQTLVTNRKALSQL